MKLAKRRFDVDDMCSKDLYKWHKQWVHVAARARGRKVLEWEPSMGWEPFYRYRGGKCPRNFFLSWIG